MKTSYIVLIVFVIILIIVLSVLGGLGYLDSSSKNKKANCKCYYVDIGGKTQEELKYDYYYKKNKKECADSCKSYDDVVKDHKAKVKYCFEDEPCVSNSPLPPTSHTQAPTSHAHSPTSHTQPPTSHAHSPTSHTQAPTSPPSPDNNSCMKFANIRKNSECDFTFLPYDTTQWDDYYKSKINGYTCPPNTPYAANLGDANSNPRTLVCLKNEILDTDPPVLPLFNEYSSYGLPKVDNEDCCLGPKCKERYKQIFKTDITPKCCPVDDINKCLSSSPNFNCNDIYSTTIDEIDPLFNCINVPKKISTLKGDKKCNCFKNNPTELKNKSDCSPFSEYCMNNKLQNTTAINKWESPYTSYPEPRVSTCSSGLQQRYYNKDKYNNNNQFVFSSNKENSTVAEGCVNTNTGKIPDCCLQTKKDPKGAICNLITGYTQPLFTPTGYLENVPLCSR